MVMECGKKDLAADLVYKVTLIDIRLKRCL